MTPKDTPRNALFPSLNLPQKSTITPQPPVRQNVRETDYITTPCIFKLTGRKDKNYLVPFKTFMLSFYALLMPRADILYIIFLIFLDIPQNYSAHPDSHSTCCLQYIRRPGRKHHWAHTTYGWKFARNFPNSNGTYIQILPHIRPDIPPVCSLFLYDLKEIQFLTAVVVVYIPIKLTQVRLHKSAERL